MFQERDPNRNPNRYSREIERLSQKYEKPQLVQQPPLPVQQVRVQQDPVWVIIGGICAIVYILLSLWK